MTPEERAELFHPDGTPRNIWGRQFTHTCVLHSKWAHEPERTERKVKVRLSDTYVHCEDGYRYDRLMSGAAVMDDVRPGVYYRRLLLETIKPIVRNRLPRERNRL